MLCADKLGSIGYFENVPFSKPQNLELVWIVISIYQTVKLTQDECSCKGPLWAQCSAYHGFWHGMDTAWIGIGTLYDFTTTS